MTATANIWPKLIEVWSAISVLMVLCDCEGVCLKALCPGMEMVGGEHTVHLISQSVNSDCMCIPGSIKQRRIKIEDVMKQRHVQDKAGRQAGSAIGNTALAALTLTWLH